VLTPKSLLAATATVVKRGFHLVFGDFNWQVPAWIASARSGVTRSSSLAASTIRNHPRQSALTAGVLFVLVISTYAGWS